MALTVRDVQPAALHRQIKASAGGWGRFWTCQVGPHLWWTDTYRAVRVEHYFQAYLADYNLEPEPRRYEVGRTLRKAEGDPPNLEKLVTQATEAPLVTAQPVQVGGYPVLVELHGTNLVAVLEAAELVDPAKPADRPRAFASKAYLDLAEALWAGEGTRWWLQRERTSAAPIVRRFEDGTPVALIMPVRAG